MYGVSSKALISLNNLASDTLVAGQLLRLPPSAKKIEIKPATKQEVITKNTNKKNYMFDEGDSSNVDVKQELKNFISGFDNYKKEKRHA